MNEYSVVIATKDRPQSLTETIRDWSTQSWAPAQIVVVDASPGDETEAVCREWPEVTYVRVPEPSAAKQRNTGASLASGCWLVFSDDDVRFGAALASDVSSFLEAHPEAVAVTPRMRGGSTHAPSKLLKAYYRVQAGFSDTCYGARLFGPAISCYPCRELQHGAVEANWLPSTLLWIKRDVFDAHRFPDFEGYSFGEDIYLTHSVWKSVDPDGKLYFLEEPQFTHNSTPTGIKAARSALARMALQNQRRIALEVMRLSPWEFAFKRFLHRIFVTAALARRRRPGWAAEVAGLWSTS